MSNIDMECPLCHVELEIPDEFGGQKVKCPSCSKMITVSDPRIARETSEKTFRVNRSNMESYTPSPESQQKSGGLPMPVIFGLVLMMIITIGVSITAIVMVTANKKDSYPQTVGIKSKDKESAELRSNQVHELSNIIKENTRLISENADLKKKVSKDESKNDPKRLTVTDKNDPAVIKALFVETTTKDIKRVAPILKRVETRNYSDGAKTFFSEYTGDFSYDIQKSDSIVSPYLGFVNWKIKWFCDGSFHGLQSIKAHYAFQDGKWLIKRVVRIAGTNSNGEPSELEQEKELEILKVLE